MKKILLLVAVVAAAFTVNAQRTVDMETTLNQPTNGQVVRAGVGFNVEYVLKNNGPDVIKPTDTLYVWYYINGVNQTGLRQVFTLNNNLEKDSSIRFTRSILFNTNQTAGPREFCVYGTVINRSTDAAIDTSRATANNNNRACANLTLTVGLGDELSAKKLNANAYPNPMSSKGTISYTLEDNANVSVKLFDITGRQVLNVFEGTQGAGDHKVSFEVNELKDGIYFYELKAGDVTTTNKVVIRK